MAAAYKKRLRIRKLSPAELGSGRRNMLSVLGVSNDPFVTLIYNIVIGPCLQLAKDITADTGIKISLTHVVNKLLALAIAENPVYNQVVLGGSIYQMEDINISNALLLPGPEQALSSIVLENSHIKSLPEISKEFNEKREIRIKEAQQDMRSLTEFIVRLFFKARLYRLLPEKMALTIGIQKGLSSNIFLSNHMYSRPAKFLVVKPMQPPMKVALKIHSCGMIKQPVVVADSVVIKEVMPLSVTTDHRILHGVHAHDFGECLERIAADPGKFMR